jgi:hypothetical protein
MQDLLPTSEQLRAGSIEGLRREPLPIASRLYDVGTSGCST